MHTDSTKVFISWSGQQAKQVAIVWRDLLSHLFDTVVPFMSEADIGAGERPLPKIEAELEQTRFGIIVMTQENQNSQWLNFEAGALSKNVPDAVNRVAPSLVDFELKSDATGPLSQFQANLLDRDGIENILVSIAKVVDVNADALRRRFDYAWNAEYRERFSAARNAQTGAQGHRDQRQVLDEILTIARGLLRNVEAPASDTSGLLVPLDLALKLPKVLEDFPATADLPTYLSVSDDDGRPCVVMDIDRAPTEWRTIIEPLAEALSKIGFSSAFRYGYAQSE